MSDRRRPLKKKIVRINGMNPILGENGEDSRIVHSSDGDLSDEDALKSGSATGLSEAETEETNSKKEALIKAKSLNGLRQDPCYLVLDKIDAELSSMNKSKSSNTSSRGKGSTTSKRSGSGAGNKTGSCDSPKKKKRDTGQIPGEPNDLDSDAAFHVDQKFKAIMQKKKGGYLDNPRASDAETIRTEDYERAFKETLVDVSDSDTLEAHSVESDTLSGVSSPRWSNESPQDGSIREELSWDYYDTPSTAGVESQGEATPSHHRRTRTAGDLPLSLSTVPLTEEDESSRIPPAYPKSPRSALKDTKKVKDKARKGQCHSYISDTDSIRTEDFEVKFHEIMINDPTESEGNTTDDPLHAKVKEILRITAPCKEKEEKKSERKSRADDRHSRRERNGFKPTTDRVSPEVPRHEEDDSLKQEIDMESMRVQREIEQERRASRPHREAKSPSRVMLSLGEDPQDGVGQSGPSYSRTAPGKTSPVLSLHQESGSRTPPLRRPHQRSRSHDSSVFRSKLSSLPNKDDVRRSKSPTPRISSTYTETVTGSSPRPGSPPFRSTSPIFRELVPQRDIDDEHSMEAHKDSNRSPPESYSKDVHSYGKRDCTKVSRDSPARPKTPEPIKMQDLSVLRSRSMSPRVSYDSMTSQRTGRFSHGNNDSGIDIPSQKSVLTVTKSSSPRSDLSVSFQDQLPPPSCHPVPKRITEEANGEEGNSKGQLNLAKSELRLVEKRLKSYRAQAEDARTQLMLTEFKRDNVKKDLERMSEELQRRKREVKDCENQVRSRLSDMRNPDMSNDRINELVNENENLKMKVRQVDGLELERDELVRQLELAKEDLFTEQRKFRQEREELKEEVENLTMLLEDKSSTKDLVARLQKTEQALKQMEAEKDNIMKENNRKMENVLNSSRGSLSQLKAGSGRIEDLQQEVADLYRKSGALQQEIQEKDKLIGKLRMDHDDVKKQLTKEVHFRENMLDDHRKTLQTLRKDMDVAMVQLRENMFLEKQQALDTLRCSLEDERRTAISRADTKLTQHLNEHLNMVKAKEEEIARLIDLVKSLEEDRRETEKQLREEARDEVKKAVQRERQSLEADYRLQLSREKENLEGEVKVKLRSLSNELEQEKRQRDSAENQLQRLKKDLEEQKQESKQAAHEKMVAVARAKEQVRNDMQLEFDKIKEKIKTDHQREINRLQETIRQQEEELRKLKHERLRWMQHEKNNSVSMDKLERAVINEVNEECRKTSNVLGVGPRRVNFQNFYMENDGIARTPTSAALANLRACNEELRNFTQELRHEVDMLKSSQKQFDNQKEEMVAQIKQQLEREKNMELEKLRQKLSKGSEPRERQIYAPVNEIIPYQSKPPRGTQQEYRPRGQIQQQEVDRLEREIRKLAAQQKRLMTGAPPDYDTSIDEINTQKMINQLQARVADLDRENSNLRNNRFISNSVPDLSSPAYYNSKSLATMGRPMTPSGMTPQQERLASMLEQRAKYAEWEADVAAEQQARSRSMMSQKMGDMTKLQNALTNQTKDIIQLNRAYSSLNNLQSQRPYSGR